MQEPAIETNFAKEKALEQIQEFRLDFGEGHYWLACHAAMPLALSPALLYTLRANFLFDNQGQNLFIPWIAVADVLLHLCKESGHELYQMKAEVRQLLMEEVKQNPRFQSNAPHPSRITQLSHFLLAYVKQLLYSSDASIRTFAEAQSWAALTYLEPELATQKIAQALAQAQDKKDQHEQVRLQLLLNNLLTSQPELDRLRQYAQGNAANIRGKQQKAQEILVPLQEEGLVNIAGVNFEGIKAEDILSEVEQKSDFVPLKVYLSNSNQLKNSTSLSDRQLYEELFSFLNAEEEKGTIEFNSYLKKRSTTKAPSRKEVRDTTELVILPVKPSLIENGATNRSDIIREYQEKTESGNGLVIPIIIEPLGKYEETFSIYPQLPKDGSPLSALNDIGNFNVINPLREVVARLVEQKRSQPNSRLNVLDLDFSDLLFMPGEKKEPSKPLSIYLSYVQSDHKEVQEIVALFTKDQAHEIIDPYAINVELSNSNIASESSSSLEKSNLVLAFITPAYLADTYLLDQEWKTAKDREANGLTKLLPVLTRPCLLEYSLAGLHGGIPVSGIPIYADIPLRGLSETVEQFESIANRVLESEEMAQRGETAMGLWNLNEDFYPPPFREFDSKALGKIPQQLMIRYSPADRLAFEQLSLQLAPLVLQGIIEIDQQEFGISKIDPETEQFYAIDKADIILNLLSETFLQDPVYQSTAEQLYGNAQGGIKRIYSLSIQEVDLTDTVYEKMPLLTSTPPASSSPDSLWLQRAQAFANAISRLYPKLEIDESQLPLEELLAKALADGRTSLDLSSRRLSEVPAEVTKMDQLQVLNLNSNNLSQLPDAIFRLTQLEELHLADNQLSTLPEIIGGLQSLRLLNLSNNRFRELPIELQLLNNLKELRVFNNPLLIATILIHDNPDDLLDLILENQDRAKNLDIEFRKGLQRTINAQSKKYKLAVDGILGPAFFEALYQWQELNKLKPGALDKETLSVLQPSA